MSLVRIAAIAVLGAIPFNPAHGEGAVSFMVILDPGHGGEDTGAIRSHKGRRHAEKNLTLALARETARQLKARGVAVTLTRSDDRFVDLDARTELANKAAAKAKQSVFVSIHANSSDEPRSAGAETYVFNAASNEASRRLADLENGKRWSRAHATVDLILADLASTANFEESTRLACAIQAHVTRSAQTPVKNRGVRQALFYVLMQTRMPSVLFEPGFLSNPRELEHLSSPSHRRELASKLVEGVLAWRRSGQISSSALSAISKSHCQIH